MKTKTKTKTILLSIFTLGIYKIVVDVKAKKQLKHTNEELKVSTKQAKNIDQVISHLGGADNIVTIDNSIYGLKLNLNDIKLIDKEALKQDLQVVGVLISGNKLTLNIGDNAPTVAQQLKDSLGK